MVSSKERMKQAVVFDFNGTLFLDTCFHEEAWSRVYRELCKEKDKEPDPSFFCGPPNDVLLYTLAPELTKEERQKWSVHKEAIYRKICMENSDKVHLTAGAKELFLKLRERRIPYTLATASIKDNMDFYFKTFHLEQWFEREMCVYDDGAYANKGEMQVEAARRLGTTLSECIVIEDSISAIGYARENNAGKVIGIGSDSVHPELIRKGAVHCIRDFTEFDFEWLNN